MIKVLHITFNMSIAGTEQVIRQLVDNIDRSIYESSILCIDNVIGEFGQDLLKKGFAVTALKRNMKGLDFELLSKLHEYIIVNNIDLVHCHQYTPYTYGLLSSFKTKAAVIFTEHGRFYPDKYKWKRVLINRFLNLRTDAITAISKSTADALEKFEFFPKSKIKVIYNGISDIETTDLLKNNLKQKLNIPSDVKVLGTISRLDPIKNQKMMLKSFKNVLDSYQNTVLLILGDGPIRTQLEVLANELEISDKVIFMGFKINPRKYLNIMDVFLLSSLSEGTSMTLLDAMAFSKPCVVTNVGGNSEIVVDGITGFITSNDDEVAFSDSIITLLKNDSLRETMGDSGRLRYESHFTIENMVNSYQNIYTKLMVDK